MRARLTLGLLLVSIAAPTVLAEERVRGILDVLLTSPLGTAPTSGGATRWLASAGRRLWLDAGRRRGEAPRNENLEERHGRETLHHRPGGALL